MKIVKYAAAGSLAGALLPTGAALAAWELNMPVGVTELSRDIHGLHMLIFWICVLIAIAVFGMMIYSIVKFRHSEGAVPANFDHSTKAEIIWTIIPVAILVGMAIPAAATLVKIEDTRDSDMTIKVTGYQWKWHYEYLNEKVGFFSTLARDSDAARQTGSGIDPATIPNYLLEVDNPLVVPVGAKVRVLLTANDVIHAWWVPAFGMKKDAIPGFVNELWFRADEPGIYRGQCAELCGRDHAFMPVVVNVLPQAEYDSWLAEQQGGAAPAAAASAPIENAAPATVAVAE
jgi:cytochrome c oxidase subunit 2